MFDFLKKILRKPRSFEAEPMTPPPAWKPRPVATPAAPAKAQTFERPATRGVMLPLRPILDVLPLELQPRVLQQDVGDATISVPLEKILAQLSKGCVRISFAELRHAAPEVFASDADKDAIAVTLPLGEILSRINPALITRRRAQRQVDVPEEISSPFDKEGQSLVFAAEPEPAHATNRFGAKPPPPAGPGRVTLPPAHTPAQAQGLARQTITSTPSPTVPGAIPMATPSLPESRVPYRNGSANGHGEANGKGNGHGTIPMQAKPAETAKPAPAPQLQEAPLTVSLSSLAESWPDAVRKEIVDLQLVDAKLALPFEAIGQALKQGRIVFTWRTVRSWITPHPVTAPSSHEGQALELPLKIVAPLYLARQQQNSKPQEKIKIDEDIPNLFFGFPQPDSASQGANARPEDTNYYVWDDVSESARVDESAERKAPTPGTRFVSKYATPNEVVSRAAGFEGVAGALIALPDGLMVASQLPSDIHGETLAAFLPQIFGKVSTCTKELRMGELNNLNFTVGNVPWKIFRVNAIFFAAFGRSGQPLPTGQLAALAAELDHKPRN